MRRAQPGKGCLPASVCCGLTALPHGMKSEKAKTCALHVEKWERKLHGVETELLDRMLKRRPQTENQCFGSHRLAADETQSHRVRIRNPTTTLFFITSMTLQRRGRPGLLNCVGCNIDEQDLMGDRGNGQLVRVFSNADFIVQKGRSKHSTT